jgi:hypothetical protein
MRIETSKKKTNAEAQRKQTIQHVKSCHSINVIL